MSKKLTEEQKIQLLVQQIQKASEDSIKMIQSIVVNIVNFFDNEKLRKLPLTNKKIQESLLAVPPAIELLMIFKFKRTDTHLELPLNDITIDEIKKYKIILEKAMVFLS